MKSACVLLLLASASMFAQTKAPAKASKPYTCVAGPDEKCASDRWYADYQKFKALQAKYAIPQEVADQMQGMIDRLIKQVPEGYKWDDDKERFVKMPPATNPNPVPAEKK